MEQRGFEIVEEGSWEDAAAFCSQVADAVQEDIDTEEYQRFDRWRPRVEDSKHDLREKTAEEESIQATKVEEDSEGMKTEMRHAGQEMKKSGKDMVHRKPKESLKDVGEAGNSTARGFLPPVLRLFRILEKVLYVNVMGKTSPDYFEGDTFTVAIEQQFFDRGNYRVRVVFEDEELLDSVNTRLDEE